MNKKYSFVILSVLSLSILSFTGISGNTAEITEYVPAPPFSGGPGTGGLGDRTGSPVSSSTCTQCHSGGSFNAAISIQVLDGVNPITEYTAGNTYTVVYTVTGSAPAYGFQGGALTSANAAGGSFSAPSANAQLVTISGRPYIEHDNGPSASGVFQSTWTAPAVNTGDVSFYGIGLAVNQNGGTSGDQTSSPASITISEIAPTTIAYTGAPFCDNDSDPTPQVNGVTTGTYSSTAGLSINSSTGVIDISNSTTGTYTITYTYGGDVATTSITINPTYNTSTSEMICSNETLLFGTQTLDQSNAGLNTETFQSISGCDSIVELTLTVLPAYEEADAVTICSGDTYDFNGTILTAADAGLNTTTFQALNGCDSIVNLTLTVEAIDVTVTAVGDVLSVNQTGGTYQWLECPSLTLIGGATDQNFTASAFGDYAVTVDLNGCSATSACFSYQDQTGSGISDNNFGDGLLIYPNPTFNDCSIDLGEVYQSATVSLTDLNGRLITTKTFTDSQILTLEIEEPVGTYILIIEAGDRRLMTKLIKE